MKPQILDRALAHKGYLSVTTLKIRLADGHLVSREMEEHGNAAAVLPYDENRRCALVVRLFRAPAGSANQSSDPRQCISA